MVDKLNRDQMIANLMNFPVFESPRGMYRCSSCGRALSEIRDNATDNVEALTCKYSDCSLEGQSYEYMAVLDILANNRGILA